jgi:SpoIIAA-like
VLQPIAGLPDGVIGFEGAGRIEASDYRDVLLPAIDALVQQGRDVRIVLVFEQFEGMSAGGAWQDMKLGVENLTKWKRIALVTDLDWMITVASLFGWMTPGELRRFPLADRDRAIAWAADG